MSVNDTLSGVAKHSQERLAALRGQANQHGIFTSDFSVNEFLMVRQVDFEPIGLCLGTCVYHAGIQYGSWSKNEEMVVMSQAMYKARELAMARMRKEAETMGADGIVGVKLTVKPLEFDRNILEFIAFGTGVIHSKYQEKFKAHDGGPFTSDLSGQDFMVLLHSGYRPVEMVMGSCVYHVAHRSMLSAMQNANQNVELEQYTAALYDARELAMERMTLEAKTAQAEGVVGVDMHEGNHGWQSHVIEFFAIGTAVSPLHEEIAPEKIEKPMLVYPVND